MTMWQAARQRKATKGGCTIALCKKKRGEKEREHQRTTRWTSNVKLWKCIWRIFCKMF